MTRLFLNQSSTFKSLFKGHRLLLIGIPEGQVRLGATRRIEFARDSIVVLPGTIFMITGV